MKFTSLTVVQKSDSLVPCVVDNDEQMRNDFVVSPLDSMEVLVPEVPIFPQSLGFPRRGLTSRSREGRRRHIVFLSSFSLGKKIVFRTRFDEE